MRWAYIESEKSAGAALIVWNLGWRVLSIILLAWSVRYAAPMLGQAWARFHEQAFPVVEGDSK